MRNQVQFFLTKKTSTNSFKYYLITDIQSEEQSNFMKQLFEKIKKLKIKIDKQEEYTPETIKCITNVKSINQKTEFSGQLINDKNFKIVLRMNCTEKSPNVMDFLLTLKISNSDIDLGFALIEKTQFSFKNSNPITDISRLKLNRNNEFINQKRRFQIEGEDNSAKTRALSKPKSYYHNDLKKINKQFSQITINEEENKKYELSSEIISQSEVGLENEGNLCYMNGALQIFFHTKPFIDEFLKESKEKKILKNPSQYPLSSDFFYLIKKINDIERTNERKVISPVNFAQKFFRLSNNFKRGEQADAESFIRTFLEIISSELKNSFSNLFYGTIETKNYLKCGHIVPTLDNSEFLDIPIPIPQQNKDFEIAHFLYSKFSKETQFSSNRKCNVCFTKKSFIEKCKLVKAPIILILTLQRQIYNNYYKSTTNISIPPYLQLNDSKYSLYAINFHFGTIYSGHYYS